MQLYTYFRSSAAYRVRIALNLKGLPYEPTVVWLPSGEQAQEAYKKTNPQALVPALVDGDVTLSQSLAIIEYLDETKPGTPLLPEAPAERARARSLAQAIACDIHPVNNLRILKYLKTTMGQEQAAIDEWYRHWCHEGLGALERELSAGPERLFALGDTPGLVDLCLVPQIFNALRFKVDMTQYPVLARIDENCQKLPAFADAAPMAQPEANDPRLA
ncbi:MAG: maleylacetoacetate isomerase [Burkholderiaceae bacterium]